MKQNTFFTSESHIFRVSFIVFFTENFKESMSEVKRKKRHEDMKVKDPGEKIKSRGQSAVWETGSQLSLFFLFQFSNI